MFGSCPEPAKKGYIPGGLEISVGVDHGVTNWGPNQATLTREEHSIPVCDPGVTTSHFQGSILALYHVQMGGNTLS